MAKVKMQFMRLRKTFEREMAKLLTVVDECALTNALIYSSVMSGLTLSGNVYALTLKASFAFSFASIFDSFDCKFNFSVSV